MLKKNPRFPGAGLIVLLLVAWGSTACQSSSSPDPDPDPDPYDYTELVRQFNYDGAAALDIQETAVTDVGAGSLHDLSYRSPRGGRVPAFLLIPNGSGPFPGVVFLHWGVSGGNKNEFLPDAMELAGLGIASLSIDAPFVRPEWDGLRGDPLYIQTVIDLRRAADLLLARSDIDPQRLGFCGHSFGATWGGVLAGVDRRFRSFVLMAGHSQIGLCSTCGEPASQRLWAVYYIGHAAPAALLFQFATQDAWISRAAAENYYETASNPKSIIWYDTDHGFNTQAMIDRINWLRAQFGL